MHLRCLLNPIGSLDRAVNNHHHFTVDFEVQMICVHKIHTELSFFASILRRFWLDVLEPSLLIDGKFNLRLATRVGLRFGV